MNLVLYEPVDRSVQPDPASDEERRFLEWASRSWAQALWAPTQVATALNLKRQRVRRMMQSMTRRGVLKVYRRP